MNSKELIAVFFSIYDDMLIIVIGPVFLVLVTNDCKYLVTAGIDKTMKLFDLETKQLIYYFKDIHKSI